MTTLEWVLFGVGATAALANTLGILGSVLGDSDYYPPGDRDWRFYTLWGLSHVVNAAILGLAYLQWQRVALPWPVVVVGTGLFVVGFAVAIAAGLDLGVEETSGLAGELRTNGWYRYTRNPQYVGYTIATIGFPMMSAAPLATVLCGIYLLWWLAFPFAEEPWLRERYGEAYDRYAEEVPRFVGRHTLAAVKRRVAGSTNAVDGQSRPR